MNREDIISRIGEVAVEQLGLEEGSIKENVSLVDDLGADSLDVVELVMAFEDEFEVTIPDTAFEHIKTVGDAATYILEQRSA